MDPWTLVLTLVTTPSAPLEPSPEATHRLAVFFLERHLLVQFRRPNVLAVTGTRGELTVALTYMEQDSAVSDMVGDAILCAGFWLSPYEEQH